MVTDAGYRGHNAPKDKQFKAYVAGMKRGLTRTIKRYFRRRSAVERVIGHTKNEHRMDRNCLAHATGDTINAVLAAAGHSFSLLLRWLTTLCVFVMSALSVPSNQKHQIPA